jgi:hypothetical protein
VWRYTFDEVVLEKRLFMPNEQNSIFVTYTLVKAAETIRFGLRPMVAIRMHEAPVDSHRAAGTGTRRASAVSRGERRRGGADDQARDPRSCGCVHR